MSTEGQLAAVSKELAEAKRALTESEQQREESEKKLRDLVASAAIKEEETASVAEGGEEGEDEAPPATE